MQYRHALAILAITLFSAIIALILLLRGTSVTELFTAIIGCLIVAIFGVAWWGFKDKIEEKEKFTFYSPIHSMIVRINKEFPRQKALDMSIGGWISASLINYQSVSETFDKNSAKFSVDDLKMWIDLEKEIKSRNGFFLGKNLQKWFDTLESKYNQK
jgi:hypothetical protein